MCLVVMLPGRRLRYLAADIGTHQSRQSSLATLAIRVMTEMRDNGTVAFIGPDDTCRSEALVAAAWNLPMISYVSFGTPLYQYYLTVKSNVSSLLRSKTPTGENKPECNFVYCLYMCESWYLSACVRNVCWEECLDLIENDRNMEKIP
jgi:hypothetical protein